jgi:CheY-like chemotaxis protein
MFGVGAAADDPLIRSPRSRRKQRTSAEIAGAVSAVPALVLDLLATPKSAASRMAGSGDRCQDSDMPPTVLIVDDHPSFRVTARALLEAEGFDVVGEAEDGETALEEAARLHPEVVLLDVQLPGIDGFEVAARLTSWNGASPAVVLTSSRDATEFSGLVERSGARGFVPKAELSAAALTALLR